jgi:hypothetical protein
MKLNRLRDKNFTRPVSGLRAHYFMFVGVGLPIGFIRSIML